MLHTRTKSVCIRVSEEELETMRAACARTGTRSISELAREAMHRIVLTHHSAPLSGQDMRFWLQELRSRLASLQSEVERIADHPYVR